MLHATYRGRTRLPQQHYATARDCGGVRRTQEDEITSTVFGPLALMPQETSYRFWSRLVAEVPGNAAGWSHEIYSGRVMTVVDTLQKFIQQRQGS